MSTSMNLNRIFITILTPIWVSCANAQSSNIFSPFIGEWTLKENKFEQVWDGKTKETLTILNHHTKCKPVNTDKSVLCVVDTPELKGHIFWTYDSDQNQIHHLSHFGQNRNGVGTGTINNNGDLKTRVRFQGESEGSYRIYDYKWVSKDEYTMHSTQYDSTGKTTGNWYGGIFVRK